jgi:ribosomal protein L11 methyltransferase
MLVMIEPSMGFGTGHHPTTRLCLRLLSDVHMRGTTVLDIGTGSGVLAIAAALSGARVITGADVDPDAIASAVRNLQLNPGAAHVRFVVSDFRTDAAMTPADLVVANLTAGMLTSAAPALLSLVSPGGTLIVSGFDTGEAPAVRSVLGQLAERSALEEATWMALRLQMPASS